MRISIDLPSLTSELRGPDRNLKSVDYNPVETALDPLSHEIHNYFFEHAYGCKKLQPLMLQAANSCNGSQLFCGRRRKRLCGCLWLGGDKIGWLFTITPRLFADLRRKDLTGD